jgi:hypothetical protein
LKIIINGASQDILDFFSLATVSRIEPSSVSKPVGVAAVLPVAGSIPRIDTCGPHGGIYSSADARVCGGRVVVMALPVLL